MFAVSVILGIALAATLAVALWWKLMSPGKRLRIGAFTLYYAPTISAEMASRAAQYLKRENFESQPMDARLTCEKGVFQLQMICTGQPDERQVLACEVLAAGLSDDVFAGNATEVQICDTVLRPFLTIPHRRRFGRRIAMNAAHLFYLESVTDEEALNAAVFLAGVGVFDDRPKIAQMEREGNTYQFRLAVEVDPLTAEMIEGQKKLADDLSRALQGNPVAVHFEKGLPNTLKTVEVPPASSAGVQESNRSGGPYRTEIVRTAPPDSTAPPHKS